jgi:hypothetical protein
MAESAGFGARRFITMTAVRVGVADHLGWAVAVTAAADHAVVDRRRMELVEPGVSAAPIHYDRGRLDVAAAAAFVATVRASATRACSAALDDLAGALSAPVVSISLRFWPPDFPDDIAVQRRAPYEAQAAGVLGERADEVLRRPRATLGPPWTKDHRVALAATVVAGDGR